MTEAERLTSPTWQRFIGHIAETMQEASVTVATMTQACSDVGVTEADMNDLIYGRSRLNRNKLIAIAASLGVHRPYART